MVRKQWTNPPETKYFGSDMYDLLDGPSADGSFPTKAAADKHAAEWRAYPKDAKARVLKIKNKYWVYGN